jgi:outer membrane protein TolC
MLFLCKTRPWTLLLCATALAGCAGPPAPGLDAVSQLASAHLGQSVNVRVRTDSEDDRRTLAQANQALLGKPLSVDDAVKLAVLNSPSLQSLYASVDIGQTDLAQLSGLQNPSFTFQRTHAGAQVELERTLGFNLINLLTAPLARRVETGRLERIRLSVANDVLAHADETRRGYYSALAARQSAAYALQISDAADAGAELAQRMTRAGNMAQRDLARQQAAAAEARTELLLAEREANTAREALTVLIGLPSEQSGFTLPERLPDLPDAIVEQHDIEQIAVRERLDLRAATLEAAQTATSYGLTRRTRLINVFELAYADKRNTGQPAATGYAITLELPLFDWGGARVAGAQARYMQSLAKVAEVGGRARSEARERYINLHARYEVARQYRDQVIPLRKKIADETLLRYNGMLASVFELLADAREQSVAVKHYIEALNQYWLAESSLEAALAGRLPALPADTSIKPSTPADSAGKETSP